MISGVPGVNAMTLMYKNNIGSSMEACSTPNFMYSISDLTLLTTAYCERFER